MNLDAISKPNPPPLPSRLPDEVLQLACGVRERHLDEHRRKSIRDFRNAADYIAAAMIFLRDNCLLDRPLEFGDIKPRLLGRASECSYH